MGGVRGIGNGGRPPKVLTPRPVAVSEPGTLVKLEELGRIVRGRIGRLSRPAPLCATTEGRMRDSACQEARNRGADATGAGRAADRLFMDGEPSFGPEQELFFPGAAELERHGVKLDEVFGAGKWRKSEHGGIVRIGNQIEILFGDGAKRSRRFEERISSLTGKKMRVLDGIVNIPETAAFHCDGEIVMVKGPDLKK